MGILDRSMSLRTAAVALLIGAAAAVQPTRVDETSVEFLSVSEMVTAEQPKGNVTIYGDMNVQGSLRTTSIQSSNLTVDGSLNVNADLKASKLKVDNLHADSIETMRLSSPSGAIMVDADLTISSISTDTVAASFLEVGGAKQWALVFHEDFQEKVSGWTPVKVSSCGGEDKFLGGHCNFAADTASRPSLPSTARTCGLTLPSLTAARASTCAAPPTPTASSRPPSTSPCSTPATTSRSSSAPPWTPPPIPASRAGASTTSPSTLSKWSFCKNGQAACHGGLALTDVKEKTGLWCGCVDPRSSALFWRACIKTGPHGRRRMRRDAGRRMRGSGCVVISSLKKLSGQLASTRAAGEAFLPLHLHSVSRFWPPVVGKSGSGSK